MVPVAAAGPQYPGCGHLPPCAASRRPVRALGGPHERAAAGNEGPEVVADHRRDVGHAERAHQRERIARKVELTIGRQVCLEAAGAKASDIVLTRAYVTDADAFKKNADVFARYLGPVSTVTPIPSLSAGPDFLVEIEAVANPSSPTSASFEPKR